MFYHELYDTYTMTIHEPPMSVKFRVFGKFSETA